MKMTYKVHVKYTNGFKYELVLKAESAELARDFVSKFEFVDEILRVEELK